MNHSRFKHKRVCAILILLSLLLSTCAQSTVLPAATPAVQPAFTQTPISINASSTGVRSCLYVPGQSKPLPITPEMFQPPEPAPLPTAILFIPTSVDPKTTERQIALFDKIWNLVNDRYAYRDFHGVDWAATGKRYEAFIHQGLSMEDFYRAMNEMIQQLGDHHSSYISLEQVKLNELARQGKTNFVGIGGLFNLSEENGQPVLMIISTLPDSPAEQAGLQPHDTIIQVDGGLVFNETGSPRTAGPENTPVTITVRSPGQSPRNLTLVRKRIQRDVEIGYCLVPKTNIGYISVRSYTNTMLSSQISEAITKMSIDAPLEGLILDNRSNHGGEGSIEKAVLALFTKGEQGRAVGIGGQDLWNITAPLDIHGSQTVPMVVLVDEFSESGGEIIPGMLQNSHRAEVVGLQTQGHTDALEIIDFEDGSQLYLATMAFQPVGRSVGQWEKKGVTPDIVIPARWNQYSEANDPMLAKAVEVLLTK